MHIALVELQIAAGVVGMSMGVDHNDVKFRQPAHAGLQVANTHSGINQQRAVLPLQQEAVFSHWTTDHRDAAL